MSTTIVWTRSQSDWSHDRKLLQPLTLASDVDILHLPLITFRPLTVELPSRSPGLCLVSSQKSVQILMANSQWVKHIKQHAWQFVTFGRKTEAALKAEGLAVQRLEAKNGLDFIEQLRVHFPAQDALYLCAQQPAVAIDKHLNQHGWQVERLALYQSVNNTGWNKGLLAKLGVSQRVFICFASPSACESFAEGLKLAGMTATQHWTFFSIGATTSSACRRLWPEARLIEASEPLMESIVDLIRQQI